MLSPMRLEARIKQAIQQNGFITIDRMMEEILTGNDSYYGTKQSIVGTEGDFTTSPEISQLFGEIIALWCIEQWQEIGSPTEFNLIELGPGNGVLMRDLLNVTKLVPQFGQALQLHMLEINPHLKRNQQKILAPLDINYQKSIKDLPPLPSIIIANEFFDALPVKQYIKQDNSWHEVVFVMKNDDIEQGTTLLNLNKQAALNKQHPNAPTNAIVEESTTSIEIMRLIKEHLSKYRGAALIIDYGYYIKPQERNASQYNSTLQAVKNHRYHPLPDDLGQADWSAHIDFYALQQRLGSLKSKVITQREFLINYGILLRAETLKNRIPLQEQAIIDRQLYRLIGTSEMGELFKALEICC